MHHRAADGLEMTQGGVSRSIRRLESRLGVILFLRGGRGVTLTEAGRQLFDRVEPLRVLSDAMMEIDTQARRAAGSRCDPYRRWPRAG